LISGKQQNSQITLGKFDTMFPGADVSLDGRTGGVTQTVGANSAAAIGDNNTVSACGHAPDAEALRARIIAALIDAKGMDDASRTAALRIVKDTH
jgi:hypothetical protein